MTKDEDTDMRVLKKATCPTVSGKSKISYHIGCTPEGETHIRIHSNTGGGFFSQEWVALKDVLDVLAEVPEGRAVTSWVLQPLFVGKSVNTPAFLLAALASEKLLRVLSGKKRGHQVVDPEGFAARMEKLASTTPAKAKGTVKKTTPKTSTKKAAVKKKVTARKKSA